MTPAASFYQLLSTVSFTLLGLWFVVQGLAHGPWQGDPTRHDSARHITLHFFLPGAMGLAAVLAGTEGLVWRITFVLGALLGLIESIGFLRSPHGPVGRPQRALRALGPVLWILVGAAAFAPGPLAGMAPLQLEGIATGLVFLVGLGFVWLAYAEPGPAREPEPGDRTEPGSSAPLNR